MLKTFAFVIVLTLLLGAVENKSNFKSELMIPLIVALTTKYVLGDWDAGYAWTTSDIFYWSSIIGSSYLIVRYIKF